MPEPSFRLLGLALLAIGAAIALCGLALLILGRIPGLGRLPGDILIRRGETTLYFPVVTCIVLSVLLTLLLNLILRR